MPKIQRINRSDGSSVYSVNIPLYIIQELKWNKGENIDFEIRKINESPVVILFNYCKIVKKEDIKN